MNNLSKEQRLVAGSNFSNQPNKKWLSSCSNNFNMKTNQFPKKITHFFSKNALFKPESGTLNTEGKVEDIELEKKEDYLVTGTQSLVFAFVGIPMSFQDACF